MKAYDEIMNALAFYFGDGVLTPSEKSIYEIIGQEHDPIETIANALEDYRECEVKP
ncbi:hypothetical protein [Serratia liquefaciens]|uniref:hypothetical protein n=1 Tax=Serratia liquefaciens TaxID=614 RepID=UPI00165D1F59|nr:hypothetical protein [Serratia liquefaciens]QNQ52587.1 hypothetical protein IAI46_15160 [Serratia liquefaciens]